MFSREDAVEHLGQVGNDVVQHQRLGLHDLFAAESQQLPREIGRPLRRFHQMLEIFPGFGRVPRLIHSG